MGNIDDTVDLKGHPMDPVVEEVLICLRKIIQSYSIYSHFLYKEVGLTGPQLSVLRQVQQNRKQTVGEIAKSISLSQATVTGIIERLENRGLVTRNRSRSDRRKVYVNFTESGTQLMEKSPPIAQESFLTSFNELNDWEKSMILSTLQRLVHLMETKIPHPETILPENRFQTFVNQNISGD